MDVASDCHVKVILATGYNKIPCNATSRGPSGHESYWKLTQILDLSFRYLINYSSKIKAMLPRLFNSLYYKDNYFQIAKSDN